MKDTHNCDKFSFFNTPCKNDAGVRALVRIERQKARKGLTKGCGADYNKRNARGAFYDFRMNQSEVTAPWWTDYCFF